MWHWVQKPCLCVSDRLGIKSWLCPCCVTLSRSLSHAEFVSWWTWEFVTLMSVLSKSRAWRTVVLNLPKCQARWHFSNQYLWGVKEGGLSSVRSAFAIKCDPVFQKQSKKRRWMKTSQRRAKHTSPGHRLRESSTAFVCRGRVCETDLSRWFSYIIKDPLSKRAHTQALSWGAYRFCTVLSLS